jgi:cobalamin biosynthesis protein CobT
MQSTGVADMSIQLADVCVLAAGWLLGVMWATYEVRMEERQREIDGPEEAQRENGEEGERETGEEEAREISEEGERETGEETERGTGEEEAREISEEGEGEETERDTDRPTENERDTNAQTQLITPTSWYCGWG